MGLSVRADSSYTNQECKITCDYELLRQSPLFVEAAPEVIKLFAYLAKRKKYSPDEKIISVNKDADMAFFIISGSAYVTTIHKKNEIVLQQLKSHTLCGELALLAEFKWFFNVRAKEQCEVLIITRESFQKVLQSFPDKREKMIEKVVQLRVKRFLDQTDFLLDNLPENSLSQSIWSPTKLSV